MAAIKERTLSLFVGFLLGTLVLLPWSEVLAYQPYRDVALVAAERTGDLLYLEVNFTKVECSYEKMVVIGKGLSGNTRLQWADVDDEEHPEGVGDRLAGAQTLRIRVNLHNRAGVEVDNIEVRVRHTCPSGPQADTVLDTTLIELKVPENDGQTSAT